MQIILHTLKSYPSVYPVRFLPEGAGSHKSCKKLFKIFLLVILKWGNGNVLGPKYPDLFHADLVGCMVKICDIQCDPPYLILMVNKMICDFFNIKAVNNFFLTDSIIDTCIPNNNKSALVPQSPLLRVPLTFSTIVVKAE